MKIYVAAKFEEAPRVQKLYKILRERGHEITHDWTTEDASKYSGADLAAYKAECAYNDYLGVKHCDLCLVLNHDKLYGGAAEMGMAIAWNKKIVVVGESIRENIFFHLKNMIKPKSTEAALEYIGFAANWGEDVDLS